ncbi:hypothetical protein B0I33_10178 [Prauserella shujinwangii]|uniref:Permease n=1 Tax=Prauserella shujinwangii TaxID=1453103 RepID=A0A2T0M2G4_9PSEU|nr:permease [Prauserella shujinwangii]PRX50927.1 hypothetical protein B0I33_10178 [Prauserella shujinwangii]
MVQPAHTAPHPRRALSPAVAVLLCAAVAAVALLLVKWLPYGAKTATLLGTHTWEGGSLLDTGQGPSLRAGWDFLVRYGEAVWPALVAAVVIGAAAETLLPRDWVGRVLGPGRTVNGALLAVPSMMCTCCTAPIVNALRRSGAGLRPTVAYWLGNPVLNPFVLAFLLLVGPWQWAATRLAVGALLVAGVSALAGRLARGGHPAGLDGVPGLPPEPAGRRFTGALARFAVVLIPEYAILVFAVGALRGWLFPFADGAGVPVLAAVALAAVLGTLAVIPTAGEIPVLLALATAGAAPAIGGALLITLPAVSLPSMVMVGRALGWRVTTVVGGGVAAAGAASAALLTVLS